MSTPASPALVFSWPVATVWLQQLAGVVFQSCQSGPTPAVRSTVARESRAARTRLASDLSSGTRVRLGAVLSRRAGHRAFTNTFVPVEEFGGVRDPMGPPPLD
jgi:hypothetical protein